MTILSKNFTLTLFITTLVTLSVLSSGSSIKTQQIPDSYVDVQIIIEARIKPWTFNVTVYQNKGFEPELNFVDPEDAYAGISSVLNTNQLHDQAIRDQLNFDYKTDIDYGGLITPNITVYTNQVVRFFFKALDTEHGIVIGSEGDPELDVFSEPFSGILPQHEIIEMYWQAPSEPTQLEYRCTFFCGAGHAQVFGPLSILKPPENMFIISNNRINGETFTSTMLDTDPSGTTSEKNSITTVVGFNFDFIFLILIGLMVHKKNNAS